ncbi:MAG: EamA family transporter [Acidobacteriales bacterium]|nr:EamA family transporter [Terriglobales bacterium]
MTLRKYLVLAAIALFGALGDICLERGMNAVGQVSISKVGALVGAIFTPWVALGIVLLLGFFAAYTIALSWADLTFVLPATSIGYVLIALFAQLFLHQEVTLTRWIGILLVSGGVGIVAGGPALTITPKAHSVASASHAEGSKG